MDRAFSSGSSASPPTAPASPSIGYATGGNPGTGTPATKPGAYWYHMITEEIRRVITDAGLTPDQSNLSQLSAAVASLGSAPTGTITYAAKNSLPTGYLKANGAAISRTTYAALFTAIGTTFGVGDGSTTFNLPDLRGEFIRGWDDARGVDSGRSFGSAQADDVKSHSHTGFMTGSAFATGTGASGPTNTQGTASYTTNNTGGAETRPRNIALLACIKY